MVECPKCGGELIEKKKEKFECQSCDTTFNDLERAKKYYKDRSEDRDVSSPKKKPKKKSSRLTNYAKFSFGLMFLIALMIVLAGIDSDGATTSSKAKNAAPTTVPPEPELEILDISFYRFNSKFGADGTLTDVQKEKVFEEDYKGKYVQWKCELIDMTESFWGGEYTMQMKCDPRTLTADMYVTLRKDQNEKAMTLNKGERVEFIARLKDYGEFMGHKADDGEIVD